MPSPTDRLLVTPATLLVRVEDGADTYGDAVYKVVRSDTLCNLQQAGSREDHERAIQLSSWRVFLPPDVQLRGWDAVEVDEGVYELNGDPAQWRSPVTGVAHYVEAMAVRTSFSALRTYDELGDEFRIYAELTASGDEYTDLSGQDDWTGPV